MRTPSRRPSEDTRPASFPAATEMWLAGVSYSRLEAITEMHCAVEIDPH